MSLTSQLHPPSQTLPGGGACYAWPPLTGHTTATSSRHLRAFTSALAPGSASVGAGGSSTTVTPARLRSRVVSTFATAADCIVPRHYCNIAYAVFLYSCILVQKSRSNRVGRRHTQKIGEIDVICTAMTSKKIVRYSSTYTCTMLVHVYVHGVLEAFFFGSAMAIPW